jgi:hypothetical protein
MRQNKKWPYRMASVLLLCLSTLMSYTTFARMGGAGGHGGGFGGHGGGGFGGGGGGFGSGGGLSAPVIVIIIILAIVYQVYINSQKKNNETANNIPQPAPVAFPEGLDANKIAGSFLAIQDAWQKKDMTHVRKWLSDGMYQRLATQFKMMNVLAQSNTLGNIHIHKITATNTHTDSNYQTAEVAISFTMDDRFTSSKYPEFNETFEADSDIEYWTFIKRTDSVGEKNLYDNNSCPNCGAPFEVKMGEISRCSNCNTLTNSAAYDWVLSEITQQAEYSGGAGLSDDPTLKELMKDDPFFAVQRMEDIASNVFMQIMEVLTIGDKKRLTRFADEQTTNIIMQQKQSVRSFVFDRLYVNNVTLSRYSVDNNLVNIYFEINATYRRVAIDGRLQMLDDDFVTRPFSIVLSRNKDVLRKANAVETVYSYECSSCGAPYTDTTEDHCTYCDAPVIDKQRNWVLTGFAIARQNM